jgi:outer membrane protein assembly factor BamB
MKKYRVLIIIAILAVAVILSGCVPGPRVTGSPGVALSGELVFVGYGNFIFGMNTETKSVEWHFPDESNNKVVFTAQPLVVGDAVYVGDLANNFYKINIETGNEEWTFAEAKGYYVGLAAEENGIVYAPSNDGNVYAIDPDGQEIWRFSTNHFVWAQPQINDDVIYVGSMDHSVYAVDKISGEMIWQYEMGGAVISPPLLNEDGTILFASSIGKEMVALDTTADNDEDRVLWSFNAGGALESVWGKAILVDNTLYFADTSGKIFALDADNGEEIWPGPIEFSGTIIGGLTAIEDGFVFATEEGDIQGYRFDRSSMPEWNKNIGGEIFQAPVVSEDFLAVGAIGADNLFYLYDLEGNLVWEETPEN